jgi:hypothetical protein
MCFRFWPPGGHTQNQNLVWELLLPSGTYVQSSGPIAVTKRALLTDDDDDDGRQTTDATWLYRLPAGEPKMEHVILRQMDIDSWHLGKQSLVNPAAVDKSIVNKSLAITMYL